MNFRIYIDQRLQNWQKRCDDMEGKAIFNSYVAKQLVNRGHKIIDLQPDKNRKYATVFYFEITEGFVKDLKELSHT